MAILRMFASAREVAGTGSVTIEGSSVGEVIDLAVARFGPELADVVAASAIWLNGESTGRAAAVRENDEVAILPPVSGG